MNGPFPRPCRLSGMAWAIHLGGRFGVYKAALVLWVMAQSWRMHGELMAESWRAMGVSPLILGLPLGEVVALSRDTLPNRFGIGTNALELASYDVCDSLEDSAFCRSGLNRLVKVLVQRMTGFGAPFAYL